MNIEILIEELDRLLEKNLSIEERGMMITLVLCRKNSWGDSDLMGILLKRSIPINLKSKIILVSLQDKGFIEWDGYNKAKAAIEADLLSGPASEVINFSNRIWGTSRQNKLPLVKIILPRLKEYSLEEIQLVISNRFEVWNKDPIMRPHLTLETVMRASKFPKYLDEAQRTRVGLGKVRATDFNIKTGEVFTPKHLEAIVESEIYQVKSYPLDDRGERISTGRIEPISGAQLISYIKRKERLEKRSEYSESELLYWPES